MDVVPPNVAALAAQRERARVSGDGATVAWLTAQLKDMGFEVRVRLRVRAPASNPRSSVGRT